MKNHVIIAMMIVSIVMYSQKKKNGTIYSEHPAIGVVEAMQQAFVKGDTIALAGYLADDFRAHNGMNSDPDAKGQSKSDFLKNSDFWSKNIAYLSITRSNGAYPDALEYDKSGTWVQTWDNLRGVHEETGVKINMPLHRLFVVDKNNKIKSMITYDDGAIWANLRESFAPRTNGTIYNHHDNINKVLRMVAALEHSDVDKAFGFFTDDARFTNLDMADGEFHTVAQEKEGFSNMLKDWTIESIDVRGYPDYLEYELGGAKVVQSWWDFRVKRKSDGKKVNIPVLLVHNFNDDGMITREMGYYTARAMAAK